MLTVTLAQCQQFRDRERFLCTIRVLIVRIMASDRENSCYLIVRISHLIVRIVHLIVRIMLSDRENHAI